MTRSDWLGGLRTTLGFAPRRRRRYGKRPRKSVRRATFELLEDRRLLAVTTVTTLSDTIDVDDGVTSLREAVFAANTLAGPDTIEFDASLTAAGQATMLLTLGELQITEATTINGPGQELLTINAQLQSRIFNITATTGDFTIAGLTLTGGKTTGNGGAIRLSSLGAELTVNESTISGNSAAGNGGGIAAFGQLTLTDSTVSGNSVVTGSGGGVWGENATLTNSTISGNIGEGIYSDSGNATLDSSSVSGNSGRGISGSRVTLSNSTVSNNGGAVFGSYDLTLVNSTVTGDGLSGTYDIVLIDSTVTGGGATCRDVRLTNSSVGGGIHVQYGNVTLDSAAVTSGGITANGRLFEHLNVSLTNSVVSGEIGVNHGNVTLTNSSVSGGVRVSSEYAYDFVSVNLTDSTVSGSIRADYGAVTLLNSTVISGGIRATGEFTGSVRLINSTVSGGNGVGIESAFGSVQLSSSKVSGHGGWGIQTYGGSVSLDSSTVSGNRDGGVLMIFSQYWSSSLGANRSTISGNGITGGGGGIVAKYLEVGLFESAVSGNYSAGRGGGINARSVVLTNSTVSGNTSTSNGGGISAYLVAVKYSTVTDNHSTGGTGGGISIKNFSYPSSITGSIIAGNTASGGNPDLRPGSGVFTLRDSLIGDNSGTSFAEAQTPDANGNLIGSSTGGGVIDPLLGPLADNGGPTLTHALLAGSPAIDRIFYEAPPVPTPIADTAAHRYDLNGSLTDSKGGPSLVSLGGTLTAAGYQFGPNQGLNLSSASIDPAQYSIEIVFSWAELSGGWQKILDFHDRAIDTGLYTLGNGLQFLNEAFTNNLFVANSPRHVVLTRDDATDTVRAYVDGSLKWTFIDDQADAVFIGPDSIIRFFQDDFASGQLEARGGFVDRILVFDRVLTGSEVSRLFNPPPPPTSDVPLYDQRGKPFARVFDGDGVGGLRIDMGAFELQPLPAFYGDYNEDGVVNTADYTVWRDTLGQTGVTPYHGADGNGDGVVGPEDYAVWKSHFGQTLGAGSGGASAVGDKETGRQGDREQAVSTAGQASSGAEAAGSHVGFVVQVGRRPSKKIEPAGRERAPVFVSQDRALVAWLASRSAEARCGPADVDFERRVGEPEHRVDDRGVDALDRAFAALGA